MRYAQSPGISVSFVLSALFLAITLVALERLWGPLVGEMRLVTSEREFRSLASRTKNGPAPRRGIKDADIVVLGDFSGRNRWQLNLRKMTRSILTYYYPNVGCV
jgi:hypothetical protein